MKVVGVVVPAVVTAVVVIVVCQTDLKIRPVDFQIGGLRGSVARGLCPAAHRGIVVVVIVVVRSCRSSCGLHHGCQRRAVTLIYLPSTGMHQ